MDKETICQEADRLVSGDRRSTYGHPLDNFMDTAALLNALLRRKLKTDLVAEDVALIMVALKLARESFQHKRDNLVDACGYLKCLDLVIDERAARAVPTCGPEDEAVKQIMEAETTTLMRVLNKCGCDIPGCTYTPPALPETAS